MNKKVALLSVFTMLFTMSSMAWEHDGVYKAAVGEKKYHDFGAGGRVDKLSLRLENHSNVGFQIEVLGVMGVLVCMPTIDGKTVIVSDKESPEPLAFMDSNGFMLVKSGIAKAMFSEKAKQMGDTDQLLIEADYNGATTYTVLTLAGNEYHVKYRW